MLCFYIRNIFHILVATTKNAKSHNLGVGIIRAALHWSGCWVVCQGIMAAWRPAQTDVILDPPPAGPVAASRRSWLVEEVGAGGGWELEWREVGSR